MKKTTLILLLILICGFVSGQSLLNPGTSNKGFQIPDAMTISQNQVVVIVMNAEQIIIKDLDIEDVKPKWIKSVSMDCTPFSKKLYKSDNCVIFLYTEHKYNKKLLRILKRKYTI